MPLISKKNNKKGFSLAELMVVTAIISIITGAIWVNFRNFDRVFKLERDVGRMAQEIRRSLEMTMAMRDFAIPADCSPGVNRIVSYGVRFQTGDTFYRRVIYVIEGHRGISSSGHILCSRTREIEDRIDLEQGAKISLIEVFSDGPPATVEVPLELNIIFVPPHPRIYIENIAVDPHTERWSSGRDAARISVSLGGTDVIRRVRINRAGLIEIVQPGS